jgi:predicted dehydrogenase
MVGFNRRFDPEFIAVKDVITAGKIGTVEMGWMPPFRSGIAMCHVCGVTATQKGKGHP